MKSRDVALPRGDLLSDLYLADFAAVSEFYTYDPADPASFSRRSEYLGKVRGQNRGVLADALLAYNEKLGCPAAVRRSIAKLRAENAAAVVTGQQAGVLTGPLYTIYKTVTAVLLARKTEVELGIPAVPVFWVASEDHDYPEIDHIDVADGRGGIERLTLPSAPTGRVSVGNIPAVPAGLRLIEELAYATPEGEHKAEMLALLRRTALASDNLGEWCARIMSELFGCYGLVCFDPMEPAFRALLRPLLERALLANEDIRAALAGATERLAAKGHTPQLVPDTEHTNLFLYDAGERMPLVIEGEAFRLRGRTGRSYSLADLLDLAADHPECFSPNVVLRPVAQDVIFPTLAYVAGPGEIAYYAQLKGVYPIFGMQMPVIYPRLCLTIVEAADAAGLRRFGIDPAAVLAEGKACLDAYLALVDPIGIDSVFDDLERKFAAAYAELADRLAVLNPNLRGLSEGNLGRLLYQVNYLRRKAKQRHRQNNRAIIREFERVMANLLPGGQKQERVFNIFPYLFRYGAGFIDALIGQLALDNFLPKLLTVEEEEHGNG